MSSEQTDKSNFSSADRISQLNQIDKDVAKLLRSAGLAVKALTTHVSLEVQDETSIEQQKASFTAATSQYFSLLSSIDVRLRRQIYALEEAEIVPAEAASKEVQGSQNASLTLAGMTGPPGVASASQPSKDRAGLGGSGLGNLDVAWLNSRNDKVEKEIEAELWAEAKDLVQSFIKERTHGLREADTDVDMDRASVDPISTMETGPTEGEAEATAG
ncbi:hypothetical protein MMC13_007147 [Lambiella insularis]|nr:hypothetical protein [Lambiella insularis]